MISIVRHGVRRTHPSRWRNNYSRRYFAKPVERLSPAFVGDALDEENDIPQSWSEVDPAILPHLRSCEPNTRRLLRNTSVVDTGFHVFFLGTGSGNSDTRLSSCTFLKLKKDGILIDAGEGALRYIRHSSIKLKNVTSILITHLHSDHVLGLQSILLGWNLDNADKPDALLKVYGPPGIFNFILTNLALTFSNLAVKIEVYELTGGIVRPHWKQRGILGSFAQFRCDNLIRKTIHCDENGFWNIQEFTEITQETNAVSDSANIRIKAAEIQHKPGCQTVGYVVEEIEPQQRIDVNRANELGVNENQKFRELKNGFTVTTDDGTGQQVHPEQVLIGTPFKARKLALLGDACAIPTPMRQLCKNADVLVHEATLSEKQRFLSERRGHSTASMAGELADIVGAELLVLNHLNDAVADTSQERAREARTVIRGGTRVLSANDFMAVAVPREGFKFLNKEKLETRGELFGGDPKRALLATIGNSDDDKQARQAGFDSDGSFTFSRNL